MFYIAGAGGFGRETYDALLASRGSPTSMNSSECGVCFLDDDDLPGEVRGLRVISPNKAIPGNPFIIGVSDPEARRRLADELKRFGLTPSEVRHPAAIIGPDTTIGIGCVFLAQCHISSSVTIGNHVQVNYNATVGHDTVLEDYVTILPGANVSGSVTLETGVTVGSGAVVLQGLRVGAGAFIGAGAVVTKNIPANTVVKGVPGRW